MPRDGAIIFGDLFGRLRTVQVSCERCGRTGVYLLHNLMQERASDAKVVDLLDELTAECPKKRAGNTSDQCGARCPDLSEVL